MEQFDVIFIFIIFITSFESALFIFSLTTNTCASSDRDSKSLLSQQNKHAHLGSRDLEFDAPTYFVYQTSFLNTPIFENISPISVVWSLHLISVPALFVTKAP